MKTTIMFGTICVALFSFPCATLAADGWANTHGDTTGGAGGSVVTVDNLKDLKHYTTVFTPPYPYTMNKAARIPALVKAHAGARTPYPPNAHEQQAFQELIFIDHENLRYVEGPETTAFQIEEIKRNIDKAQDYGVHGYLLFAKEMMEAMLTYDFDVPEIGHIGQQAFAAHSSHREEAERLRRGLSEVAEYAENNGVKLYFHSNQFIFKKDVLNVIKPATWGTAVCPGREATWAVYRGKIDEFFRLFPSIAGLQITGDETQVSVLKCDCEKCRNMDFVERVKHLTNETAAAARKHGKEIQMRTWQRMGELGDPSRMEEGILDNVSFSIKNTAGDFRIAHGLDEAFLTAVASNRIMCEFDAWREYTGHNYFPCYMGEAWAPRFKFLHDRGIQRIAVRLMWNSNDNPIFDRPWGNFINIYTFLKLADNPSRSAQDILDAFVKEHYPPSARKAAMDLYMFSMASSELQNHAARRDVHAVQ